MTPIDNNPSRSSEATIYEVEFKGSRKDYFLRPDSIVLKPSDFVIVQADRGEHIGRFNRSGLKSFFPQVKELKNILRLASYTDIEIMMDNRTKEEEAFDVCQKKILEHDLKMKLVDVEYQFDGNKICFFFTADKRIDFRALVKDLAAEYRTRIELRQIGVRDEARRLGGIGVCGRTLCCKTFLNQFEPITSQMARDQNLSLSPSKISGLCGRLMCCLAFEENFYKLQQDILPSEGAMVSNGSEQYQVVKIDIPNEYFVLRNENGIESTHGMSEFPLFRSIKTQESDEGEKCSGCGNECMNNPTDENQNPEALS
ncbi:MAG: regulatory iron-sulfur-containing complex subunit RicT [Candidatus Latescibacterota bacterium]